MPRLKVGDVVMGNRKAPSNYRDRRCVVTEIIAEGAECRVEVRRRFATDDGICEIVVVESLDKE